MGVILVLMSVTKVSIYGYYPGIDGIDVCH